MRNCILKSFDFNTSCLILTRKFGSVTKKFIRGTLFQPYILQKRNLSNQNDCF